MRPVVITATLVGLATSALALSACAPEEEPVSIDVTLTGTLSGDDWNAEPTAVLTTDGENAETYLTVTLTYAGDGSDNDTPWLTARFDHELGPTECETHRSYIWSSMDPGAPMELTLGCGFVPDNVFDDISTVQLSE